MIGRHCGWCRCELAATVRRDAVYCSQSCRQAAHRFQRGCEARERAAQPMRFAYADPPYPGKAHYYAGHRDFAGEVDHVALVADLQTRQLDGELDGWALSTSARALPFVLSLVAGVDVRVAAWIGRRRPHATAREPIASWEPVVYAGGRHASLGPRYDSLVCRSGPRLTDPERVIGAKPAGFAYWLFDLLGALPGDELDDMYPGSGGISRAWDLYTSRAAADTSPRAAHDT